MTEAKWFEGMFINAPLNVAALVELWNDGDRIGPEDPIPEWMIDRRDWRYCGAVSLPADATKDQHYFREMGALGRAGVSFDTDEDGSVVHLYLSASRVDRERGVDVECSKM